MKAYMNDNYYSSADSNEEEVSFSDITHKNQFESYNKKNENFKKFNILKKFHLTYLLPSNERKNDWMKFYLILIKDILEENKNNLLDMKIRICSTLWQVATNRDNKLDNKFYDIDKIIEYKGKGNKNYGYSIIQKHGKNNKKELINKNIKLSTKNLKSYMSAVKLDKNVVRNSVRFGYTKDEYESDSTKGTNTQPSLKRKKTMKEKFMNLFQAAINSNKNTETNNEKFETIQIVQNDMKCYHKEYVNFKDDFDLKYKEYLHFFEFETNKKALKFSKNNFITSRYTYKKQLNDIKDRFDKLIMNSNID